MQFTADISRTCWLFWNDKTCSFQVPVCSFKRNTDRENSMGWIYIATIQQKFKTKSLCFLVGFFFPCHRQCLSVWAWLVQAVILTLCVDEKQERVFFSFILLSFFLYPSPLLSHLIFSLSLFPSISPFFPLLFQKQGSCLDTGQG